MGLSLGASGSKSKSKSKSTSNNTIDPESMELFQGAYNPALNILGHTGVKNYEGTLGVGLDPLQTQASDMMQGNVGAGQGALNQAISGATKAGNYTPSNVTAGQLSGINYADYMNPYLSNVLDSTLGAIDRTRQMGINSNSQAAGPGAWGGSRVGVADSLTNEAALRESAGAANSIYANGFNNAQQAGQFDINAALSAAQGNQNAGLQGAQLGLSSANALAGFGQQQQNMGLADVNAVNAFGQQAQATAQNAAQMSYDEWLRQQEYPFLQAGAYGQLAGTVPIAIDNVSTGKQKGSTVGVQGGFTYSDARLKTDVEYALTDGHGRHWFDFRYTWQDPDEPKQRGVMAQQILRTDPQAVKVDAAGFLMVDYGALH